MNLETLKCTDYCTFPSWLFKISGHISQAVSQLISVPIKGSRTEYSCSRNLNRWLNEHSSCSLILAWYATICCQPAGWSEQREISYKLRDRDEKQSLTVTVTYYSERESTWCTDFQKELLWQKLQLHLLGGSYQWGIRVDYKETGGDGGGRQESARKEVCESWASV